jgi:beta-aspartyl-peptidase (threonine type)
MLLAVHGGAGSRPPSKAVLTILAKSISAGYKILQTGGPALDAVVKSISILENSGLVNAGAGGNLQFDGVRRLDAALMRGEDLKAGSVIGLEGIKNPIKVSRLLMELPHVMLTNTGARKVADYHSLKSLPSPSLRSLKLLEHAKNEEKGLKTIYEEYFSTVGAVAIGADNNLAAGSSTGGVPAMLPGRVGDTPIIGAGVYADNSLGAISCTGSGEGILRLVLAKEICMNLKDLTPLKAARYSLMRILDIKGEAGVIVVDRRGRCALAHTTEFMAAGYAGKKGTVIREGFRRIRSF